MHSLTPRSTSDGNILSYPVGPSFLHDDLIGDVALQLLVRQANTVLDTDLVADGTLLAQDRNALDLDAVLDDAGGVAGDRGRGALDTGPGADPTVPADDGVQDTSVVLDLGVLEHDGLFDTGARADDRLGTDRDVGAEFRGRIDGGGRVDEDGRDDVGRRLGDLGRLRLEGLGQVQCVGRDGGTGRLDLAPKILGLVDEEAVAVGQVRKDVLFETQDLVLLTILIRVGDVRRIQVLGRRVRDHPGSFGLALDGAPDRREDALGGEQIHAAVDQVGDVAFGFLDVVENAFRVGVGHDAPKVGGGVVADSSAEDDGFGVLLLKELEHGLERERAADVRVQHEEAVWLALEDGVTEVVETAGGAKGLVFAEVLDLDLGELS